MRDLPKKRQMYLKFAVFRPIDAHAGHNSMTTLLILCFAPFVHAVACRDCAVTATLPESRFRDTNRATLTLNRGLPRERSVALSWNSSIFHDNATTSVVTSCPVFLTYYRQATPQARLRQSFDVARCAEWPLQPAQLLTPSPRHQAHTCPSAIVA